MCRFNVVGPGVHGNDCTNIFCTRPAAATDTIGAVGSLPDALHGRVSRDDRQSIFIFLGGTAGVRVACLVRPTLQHAVAAGLHLLKLKQQRGKSASHMANVT